MGLASSVGRTACRDVVHLLCVFDHGADTAHGAVITTLDCQAIGKAQWQRVSASIRRRRSAWKVRLQPHSWSQLRKLKTAFSSVVLQTAAVGVELAVPLSIFS